MTPTLERVTFRLKDGITDKAFLAEAQVVNTWVSRQPGFGYRTLVKDDDGTWTDLVFWTSLEAAQAAGKAFMAEPNAKPFVSMIDGATVTMTHLAQHVPTMATAPQAA